MAIKLTENTKEPRVYEVSFLLSPYLEEDKVAERVDAIRKLITDKKGISIAEGTPKFMDLAYTIELVANNKRTQYDKAYFGWIKFDVDPKAVDDIRANVESMEDTLRSLVLKTVRENTLASERVLGKEAEKNADTEEGDDISEELHRSSPVSDESKQEEQGQVNEKELDEKIDELTGSAEESVEGESSEEEKPASEEVSSEENKEE